MRTRTTVAILGAVTVIAACSPSTESPATEPPAIDIVRSTPSPTPALTPARPGTVGGDPDQSPASYRRTVPVPATDGKSHLAYELEVDQRALPGRHAYLADGPRSRRRPVEPRGDQLTYWTRILGTPTPTTKIGPAQTARSGSTSHLDKDVAVPTQLTHDVGVCSARNRCHRCCRRRWTVNVAPATVQTRKPVGHLAAVGGPEMVGWQQLLRHDRAPHGAQPDQRPTLGR